MAWEFLYGSDTALLTSIAVASVLVVAVAAGWFSARKTDEDGGS